jgi:hypothetical protein
VIDGITMLKPGTYKLVRDVANPQPDRRKTRDWRAFPTWKADTEFLVVAFYRDTNRMLDSVKAALTPEQIERIEARAAYSVIQLVGHRWSFESIGPGNEEQYAALMAALEPVPESHEAMFTRLDVRDYFAKWLVESGRLTPQAFETLHKAYEDSGEVLSTDPVPQGTRLTSSEIDP